MGGILNLSGRNAEQGGNQPQAVRESKGSSAIKVLAASVIFLAVVCAIGFHLLKQSIADLNGLQVTESRLAKSRMDAQDERYGRLSRENQVLADKLKLTKQELARRAALIQKQQEEETARLKNALAQKASSEELGKVQADANAKLGALSGDIAGTQKDLDATKAALSGAKGELSGAIARTHDELVALAHRSDRDYFEFSLPRKHARKKIGSVMIELDHTNVKKNLFSVYLNFDDKRTLRKDKAAFEPVYFYVQGASSALELVVNKVGKDSIGGYMSAPKGFLANIPNVLAARPEK